MGRVESTAPMGFVHPSASHFHFIWGGGDSLLHECKLCSELSSAKFAWFCLKDSHQDKRKRNQFTKIPQVLQCFAMFCLLWVQSIKEISMICLFLQHVLEYSKHLQTLSHHVDLGSDGKVSWDQPLPRWTAALPQPWREHGKRCSCGYETLGGGADSTYIDTYIICTRGLQNAYCVFYRYLKVRAWLDHGFKVLSLTLSFLQVNTQLSGSKLQDLICSGNLTLRKRMTSSISWGTVGTCWTAKFGFDCDGKVSCGKKISYCWYCWYLLILAVGMSIYSSNAWPPPWNRNVGSGASGQLWNHERSRGSVQGLGSGDDTWSL